MIILTVRTDKPESELGLFDDDTRLQYEVWEAHRSLGETIHLKIKALLDAQGVDLHDIEGVIVYEGPGSFTGLRIGMSVVNALGDSLHVPIAQATGDDWIASGATLLREGKGRTLAIPQYGAPVHITKPKH